MMKKDKLITIISTLIILVVICILTLNYRKNIEEKQQIFAMDTYMEVAAYGPNAKAAVDEAIEEIRRIDKALSTGNPESEVAIINAYGAGQLTEDGKLLLTKALTMHELTNGAFNVAIYPVMELWGFTTGDYHVPSKDELETALSLSDINQISFNVADGSVSFSKKDMAIDFGGIAKGYTSSQIMEIFEKHGVKSGMVSLGGNVQVYGKKTNGSKWKVAIANPDSQADYLGYVEVCDNTAVITSGGYERYFEEDGEKYHHIIDPSTGYPAKSGLTSVTIINKDGTMADALSTSIFIMGLQEGSEYWRAHSDDFGMILYDETGKIYVTENVTDSFVCEETTEIISKIAE